MRVCFLCKKAIDLHIEFVGEAITSTKFPLVIGGEYFVPYLLNKPNEGHLIKGIKNSFLDCLKDKAKFMNLMQSF